MILAQHKSEPCNAAKIWTRQKLNFLAFDQQVRRRQCRPCRSTPMAHKKLLGVPSVEGGEADIRHADIKRQSWRQGGPFDFAPS